MNNESFNTISDIFKNAPQIRPNSTNELGIKANKNLKNVPSQCRLLSNDKAYQDKTKKLKVNTKDIKSIYVEHSDSYPMIDNLPLVAEGRRVLHLPKRASPLKSALYNNSSPNRNSLVSSRRGSIFSTPSNSPHKSKLTNKLLISNNQMDYDDLSPIKKKSSPLKLNSSLSNPKLASLLSSSSPSSSPTSSTSSSSTCSLASIRSESMEPCVSNKFDFDAKQKKRKISESPISIKSFQVNRSPIRQIKSSPLKNYNKQISEKLIQSVRTSLYSNRGSGATKAIGQINRINELDDKQLEDKNDKHVRTADSKLE